MSLGRWTPAEGDLIRPSWCELIEGGNDSNGRRRAGSLKFNHGPSNRPGARRSCRLKPPSDLWLRFIDLAKIEDDQEAVRAFAAKWGMLYDTGVAGDDVEEWLRFANLCSSIWSVSEALRRGEGLNQASVRELESWVGDVHADAIREVISVIQPQGTLGSKKSHKGMRLARKTLVAVALEKLLTWRPKHQWESRHYLPSVRWRKNVLTVKPIAHYVLGNVVLQLAIALSQPDLANCAGCGRPAEYTVKATRGSRRYCQKCRAAKVPLRDAKRDQRRRTKESKGD